MEKKLMQATCTPECGFMIRSHDEKEIIEAVKRHAKNTHNMKATDDEVRKQIKPV